MSSSLQKIISLAQKEGWKIIEENNIYKIEAFGDIFDLRHPVQIYLKLYRTEKNPERKYLYMKKAHDYLWPDTLWHAWTEKRFKAHCDGRNYITLAGGAACSKSYDCAKIAVLFWLADPKNRGVIIGSTTLESLGARIWGYAMKFLSDMKVKLPFHYIGGNTPKVLYPTERSSSNIKDTIHGMFAVAAKSGSDEKTISSLLGRHPKNGLLVVLDEATDMPGSIVKSFANLDSGTDSFQCIAIGNSNSVNDLHGAMSTPKVGWDKIDPLVDSEWETNQKNGICLFFSCYESPAVHETDPERKRMLGKFLITEEQIEAKKVELGEDSDAFYRFVLGYWRHASTESTIVSKQFLEAFQTERKAEWSGLTPLRIVAGLDPAFSTGGDQCMLRLAVLGLDTSGLFVLDFRGEELTFPIPIIRGSESADIQIGKKVMQILDSYRCPIECLAIDVTGQGRAIGGLIQLQAKSLKSPIRIYSTRTGADVNNTFDVAIKSSYDLWFDLRNFIQQGQIKGLDNITIAQLSQRLVLTSASGKRTLEPKAEYKRRIGAKFPSLAHSPDQADAAALALQSAIMNYGFTLGKRKTFEHNDNFEDLKYKIYLQEKKVEQEAKKKWRGLNVGFTGSLENWRKPIF